MSEKITMELTVEEARKMIAAPECPPGLRERIKNALPVDYAEGTIAEVMIQYADAPAASTVYAKFERGMWRTAGGTTFPPGRILKVEPILTPGDVVVEARRVENASPSKLRKYAERARVDDLGNTAALLDHLADEIDEAWKRGGA